MQVRQQRKSGNYGIKGLREDSQSFNLTLLLSDARCLLLVLLIYLILAVLVCFLNPLFEPTDEIRHYRFVRILVTEQRLPVQGEEPLRAQSHHPPLYYVLSAFASVWIPSEHTGLFDLPHNPFWGIRNWEVGVDNKLQYWHPPAEILSVDNLAVYVPRLVNVFLGAVTIGLTYIIGARLWADRKYLALVPAVFVAFNPQFIYLSAAVNNDILAGLMGTVVLYICLAIVMDGLYKNSLVWMGIAFGLAVLSKIHLAALAPIIIITLWYAQKRHFASDHRKARFYMWIKNLIIVFSITVVISGWWFIRNILEYGDISGMNRLNEMWGGRTLDNFWALKQGLPYMWTSLWGRFGYGQIPLPSGFYIDIALLCGVGVLGFILSKQDPENSAILRLYLFTTILFLCVVSYYILIQPAGAMGRFLFPVLPVFAVIVTAGWAGFLRTPRRMVLFFCAMMFSYSLWALWGYWYPAVSHPQEKGSTKSTAVYQIGDLAGVSDVSVSPNSIYPGEAVYVSVTWHPLQRTETPVTVYVHLIDEAGALIAQRDTYPGLGRAPTTSWRVGDPFVDVYRIDVPESVYSPNSASVYLGMYTPTSRLPLYDLMNNEQLAEGLNSGKLTIQTKLGQVPNPLDVNFGDKFRLIGYAIEPRKLKAGETLALTLFWESLDPDSPLYEIFAQVLDSNWQVWGSNDGGYPDESIDNFITDTRKITLLPETPSGSYPIQVGLFSSEGRLPILTEEGLHLDNRYLLGPIRVE